MFVASSATIQDAQERGEEIRMVVTQPRLADKVKQVLIEPSDLNKAFNLMILWYFFINTILVLEATGILILLLLCFCRLPKCQIMKETAQHTTQKVEGKGH